ncbi:DHA2 family efflux MFS transporter permease subunit [Tsukamurella tyrosinosolvens]|uniref:DHA2 family efflux MFS transporter permease subunit n=1 Tax=Tsukamurella tyrosinosolvens TaxID=57704 RepID=UPI00125EF0B2|nr:DHA2 family efflux MFS transporter permease subunit [Tsukamurella tyrosinosolvens]
MTATAARSGDRIDGRTWRLCSVIAAGAFASGLDATIVNVGLAAIGDALGAPLSLTQWVASAYLLALAVSLPLAGRLGTRWGVRRLWLTALGGFTAASVLCAAAPTVETLIAARVVQGLAGGLLIPTGQTILGLAVGPERLGRVMGTLGLAVAAAPAAGGLIGGHVLAAAPWPWLYLINVPIGVAAGALGFRLIPRFPTAPPVPLHRTGLVLITLGLPALVFAATRWGEAGRLTADVLVIGAAAIVALGWFGAASLRTDHPLLDLRLFAAPAFRASAVGAFFAGTLIFGSGILFALYFQLGRGLSPLDAGTSLLGLAGATCVISPFTGRWVDRFGPAPVVLVGSVLATVAIAPFAVLPADAPVWLVQALLVAVGASISLVATPVTVAAYRAVSAGQLPGAITQVNILQRIGGSLGGALCAVLVASAAGGPAAGFHLAAIPLVVSAIGCGVAGALLYRRRGSAQDGADGL